MTDPMNRVAGVRPCHATRAAHGVPFQGQAAGTAAAMALEWRVEPRAVPIPGLQSILIRRDAYLGQRIEEKVALKPA